MFKFFIPFSSLVIKLTDVIISTQWRNLQVATIIMLVLVWFEDVFITLLSLHSCCVLVNRWCSGGGGRGEGGWSKAFLSGNTLSEANAQHPNLDTESWFISVWSNTMEPEWVCDGPYHSWLFYVLQIHHMIWQKLI